MTSYLLPHMDKFLCNNYLKFSRSLLLERSTCHDRRHNIHMRPLLSALAGMDCVGGEALRLRFETHIEWQYSMARNCEKGKTDLYGRQQNDARNAIRLLRLLRCFIW